MYMYMYKGVNNCKHIQHKLSNKFFVKYLKHKFYKLDSLLLALILISGHTNDDNDENEALDYLLFISYAF